MREKVRDINSARNPARSSVPPGTMAPRRLAAIVVGDICGYSRLMQLDEEGTHARVKRIQRDLVEPSIAEHHGRLVKTRAMASLPFLTVLSKPCVAASSFNKICRGATHRCRAIIGSNFGSASI